MFDRFCFLMRWLHQGSDCQMKKLLVLPCFPELDQRFAGNLKEVGQMEPDTAPQARKKRFLGHFLGDIFLYWKRHENHPFGLKSDKKRQTTFPKNQRHFNAQNVKIWRFRHDMVTLNIGWFVDKKWFSIMPHLSLFSFCDETLVPVIFSGHE